MEHVSTTPYVKLEDLPSENLQLLLSRKFQQLINQHPTLTIDQVFYLEASRLHLELIQKTAQIEQAELEVDELHAKLGQQGGERRRSSLHQGSQSANENGSDKKKRLRRTAVEIARHYVCNIDRCNKSYGSQGSLNQHIKIKHINHYTKHILLMDLNHPQ